MIFWASFSSMHCTILLTMLAMSAAWLFFLRKFSSTLRPSMSKTPSVQSRAQYGRAYQGKNKPRTSISTPKSTTLR